MSKQQRERALRSAGKRPQGKSATKAHGDQSISCNQTVAANSENSASAVVPVVGGPQGALTGYGWYQEYMSLIERFPWRLAAYIAWASSPVVNRQPATQSELAAVLGLRTDRTIRQWREKNPDIEREIEQLQAAPLWRHRRDLYDALVRTAITGDVPALKLALEMTGDYVPRMKQTVDNTVKPGNYTADDLAVAERELQGWEVDRSNKSNRIHDGGQG